MLDHPTFHQGNRRTSASAVASLILGLALLAVPRQMQAQHGGGGGGRGMMSTGVGTGAGRPDGVSEGDDLKDFHRVMAMQATAEQRAAFAKVTQYTQTASDQLQAFRKSLPEVAASSALSERATTLDQAIEKARASQQNFLSSFSPVQKSGLQDVTKKLEKADYDFEKQIKTLDQIVQTPKPEPETVANSAALLDKALSSFQNEQLALGGAMSILFPAPGQDVTFSLPAMTNAISIAGQPISFPSSGIVSRTSAENGHNTFSLKLVADLSDVQLNITSILRSGVNRSPRCGERIEILDATLTPSAPASVVLANLHFERWVCSPGQSPMDVADGAAALQIKLTPALDSTTGLHLDSEIIHVEAEGLLRDSLRTGDLGATLRDQIAASLLAALQKGTDLKVTLPPAAQASATLQRAQFQNTGAEQMSLVLDGQLQFSEEQTQQFAAQLKQRLSANGTTQPAR
jgi:hypothetical protein